MEPMPVRPGIMVAGAIDNEPFRNRSRNEARCIVSNRMTAAPQHCETRSGPKGPGFDGYRDSPGVSNPLGLRVRNLKVLKRLVTAARVELRRLK
jgi:hypothetical protein